MPRLFASLLLWVLAAPIMLGQSVRPTLFREPALSRTQIVFHYAGDLWIVGREGGQARRLTAGPGQETNPCFSPDGQWLAFTGE